MIATESVVAGEQGSGGAGQRGSGVTWQRRHVAVARAHPGRRQMHRMVCIRMRMLKTTYTCLTTSFVSFFFWTPPASVLGFSMRLTSANFLVFFAFPMMIRRI